MTKFFFGLDIQSCISIKRSLFVFVYRITTGPLREGENRAVQEVEDHTADLDVGSFVALNFLDWDQTPVIGKVAAINDGHVTIQYWKDTNKV